MCLIENKNELKTNLIKLDEYLESNNEQEHDFAINLVKKGICFVLKEKNNKLRFYPSKFIGYVSNTMEAHQDYVNKDGRDTNNVISETLGNVPISNTEIDNQYIKYCETLGFTANNTGAFGVERKFRDIIED